MGEIRDAVIERFEDERFNEAAALLRKASTETPNPLKVQIGGDHYKRMAIQPITYILANGIEFAEGNVIKYVSRWKFKNGLEDLKKARDVLDKKIAFEEQKQREEGIRGYLLASV